ncbi:beta family protein [Methylosinus sp. KRF6]|uniref:beta family protein n=1 Tax=Methylosinus sp. KRF6 TaxID=2846853 RepID=UPI001C0B8E71|nr:beta family protein [Methylosinus sp. KRF6]MBU3891060.1 beta family protein [Methylosinus sp. KRF6]
MSRNALPIYVPALRLKQGEYRGLQRLAPEIADRIIPRLVVPPPKERDLEKHRLLTKDEIVYETGRRIADHWIMREALLDVRFLFREFGESECIDWLPRMFDVARKANAKPIPVISLADALGPRAAAFRQALAIENVTKAAIRIDSGEIDKELPSRIAVAMAALGLAPNDCTALADFGDADFSDASAVANIAQAALEDLQRIGRWRQVVFQGTNYPEVNPAEPGHTTVIPRNEWLAWREAIQLDGTSPEHLVFGDYGADCPKFEFRASRGIPIRHYRYTTRNNWLVVRGSAVGQADMVMRDVCDRILKSGEFAGRGFCSADDYIFKTANGWDGPGNGSTWREINTTHHITRVVRDIGGIKGMSFAASRFSDPADQPSFL